MADFNVTARFEADASAYLNAVSQAKTATEGLGDAADKAGRQTGRAFDGADKSVSKTGTAAERASKQTDSLGDSAKSAGSDATTAFDGVTDGIDAAGISLNDAAGDFSNLGDRAQESGAQASTAFDGVVDGIDAAGISLDGAAGDFSNLGDQAQQSGTQAASAFDGVATGVEAAGASADGVAGKFTNVGDAAGHAGKHAQSAFEGIGNGLQAANISLDGAAGKYTDLGNRASVAFQKATQGVRDHSQEITQIGGAITTIGAGWAALNTTMMVTGIQYNTLQQVASKSMETMMGSIEGANQQMERFHAFADESPFSRATFLEAQRQLMAFGMEAERVVPSLEGIQNAVAAIGGGNAEIMQLTDILGAIQGQGKITGRELQRMGQMGIDAADIIGEQMGKSGAAIREEITAGTLDADTAIQALTDGMNTRFAGAAAGLKETFEGAIDRVKAAFRDLSGESFEWAVGSDGGGFFVDMANAAADAMRAIQKLPAPVKNAMGVIGTLGSTATVAAGGFMLLAPRAVESWDAFVKLSKATGATKLLERIQSVAPAAATGLRNVGRFAGIAAGALAGIYIAGQIFTDDQIYSVEDMADAVQNLAKTGSASSMDRIFSDWATMKLPGVKHTTDDIIDLESAMARLAEPRTNSEKINQWADRAFAWTGFAQTELTQIEDKVAGFSESLAGMVKGGDIEGAATAFNVLADSFTANGGEVDELIDLMPAYIDSLVNAAAAAGVTITEQEALQWALTGIAPAAVEAAGGIDALGESDGLSKLGEEADAASSSIEDVVAKIQVLGQEFRNAFLAEGDMYAAIDNFTQALAENGATLDATTEAGQRNRQALVSMFNASEEYAASILEAGGSTDEAAGAMRTAYDTMISNAEAMGLTAGEAEALTAELLDLPDGVDIDTFFDEAAREMAIATANAIEAIPKHTVIGVAAEEDGSFVSVQERVDELGNTIATVIVDAEGNVTEVTEEIREINGHEMTVYVDAEGNVYEIEEELRELEKMRPQSTVEVDADTTDAEFDIGNLEDGRYGSTIDVDADTTGAQAEIDGVEGGEATVDTDADTSGAQTALEQFGIMDWSTTVDTTADTSGAESSITGVTAAPWMTTITGLGDMSDAESKANTAARDRTVPFASSPDMSNAENSANTAARQRITPFGSSANMSTAEGAANTTARERFPQFTGIANVGGAEGSLNTTARGRTSTINAATSGISAAERALNTLARSRTATITVQQRLGVVDTRSHSNILAPNIATGGIAGGGWGHYKDALPRHASGGRLPYTGLGTDMILARNRHGVPTAWVDDGEWVIREQMSRKYHQALGLINADHPAIHHLAGLADGGQAGRTRLVSSMPAALNVPQIVAGETRNVTYQANLHTADATMHDALDAFKRKELEESRR